MMRDFYWKRSGWRWIVATAEQSGVEWINERELFRCWRQKTAASVCSIVFETYLVGQDVAKRRMALAHSSADREAPNNSPVQVPCEMCAGSKWKSSCPECDGLGYYSLPSTHHSSEAK